MTLQTPTTKEISDNIVSQIETSISQTVPLLPKSFIRVLSNALAAVFVILYKYGGFIFQQLFVQTASFKDTEVNGIIINPLIAWGELIGVGPPTEATNAELLIDVVVENQSGFLPTGSQLLNTNNGYTYITIGDVALNAPTIQVVIRAVSDQVNNNGTGAAGNLNAGDIVSFVNPLPNVARDASVISQTETAANAESEDVYRQRVLDRFQKRPQGGAYADYEIWGEEVEGIINIYPYTSVCPGQVDIYAEATEESSGDPDGIPTQAQLDAVQESIQLDQSGLASRRPATAFVNVFPITRIGFDVEIVGLIVDNQASVEQTINDALDQFFFDAEPFIEGLSILPRKDRITRTSVAGVVEDIVTSFGGVFENVILSLNSVDIQVYVLNEGEKAKAESVTYT